MAGSLIGSVSGGWHALLAFLRARRERRGGSREALLARQERRLRRFMKQRLPRAAFYRPLVARRHGVPPLYALPIGGKAAMLENFAGHNVFGISLEEALEVALTAERSRDFAPRLRGLTVGLSSGTSGRRGVFLVGDRERARWAGLLLGRMLSPRSLWQLLNPFAPPLAIAFFLRADSNLYGTLRRRRLDFQFYDLTLPFAELAARLGAGRCDILVAPASVLAALAAEAAAGRLRLAPRQVISVAESLEPDEKLRIERAFGRPVEQIYQATEGFLGTSCEAGKIHLHEEEILFEQEWLDAEKRRFRPLLTDFRRETQLIVRYRLDDILLLAENPCRCGRPTLACEAVEGRADEVLELAGRSGGTLALFPDLLRRTMALAGEDLEDWRVEQHGGKFRAALRCREGAAGEPVEARVAAEWGHLLEKLGAAPRPLVFFPFEKTPLDHKRRRIRRLP